MTDSQILSLCHRIRSRGRAVWGAFLMILQELAKEERAT